MAKFGVNVVDLVDNMPLVFGVFFSKTFQKKKFWHSLYYKKNSDEASNKKEKFLQGKFFYPPPRISNGPQEVFDRYIDTHNIIPCTL